MKLKYAGYTLLLILAATGLIGYFHLADLRTETAVEGSDAARARALLKQMAVAHNADAWNELKTYRVSFEDEFYGPVGAFGNPFPGNRGVFDLTYIPGSFDGQMTFTEGKYKGRTWGIQSWQTYAAEKGSAPVFGKNKDAYFWLPTYQYFIEFPLRIQEATALNYAGGRTIGGIRCEGVIASWGDTAPQKDVDQYLIWLDAETHRIVKLEYTIRELYYFLTGAAYYKDYKNFNGVLLPTYFPVESNLVPSGLLHEMRITDFAADPVPVSTLRPKADLENTGGAKE